jgi:hypothetical protein
MIMPLVYPSRTLHAVCAYWLTSSDGSNAKAQGHIASNTLASRRPSARARPRVSACGAATRRPAPRVVSVLITPTSYRNLFRRISTFSLPEDWSGICAVPPGLTSLFLSSSPGTAVPGYSLFRPFGTPKRGSFQHFKVVPSLFYVVEFGLLFGSRKTAMARQRDKSEGI